MLKNSFSAFAVVAVLAGTVSSFAPIGRLSFVGEVTRTGFSQDVHRQPTTTTWGAFSSALSSSTETSKDTTAGEEKKVVSSTETSKDTAGGEKKFDNRGDNRGDNRSPNRNDNRGGNNDRRRNDNGNPNNRRGPGGGQGRDFNRRGGPGGGQANSRGGPGGGQANFRGGPGGGQGSANRGPGGSQANFRRGPGGGQGSANRGPGGGGGGAPALKLQNPLKLQRVVEIPRERPPRRDRDDNRGGGGGQRGPRPAPGGTDKPARGAPAGGESDGGDDDRRRSKSKSSGDNGGDNNSNSNSMGPDKRRRTPAKKKDERGGANDDGRNVRRASLRIGTGKKGRAASLTSRRGSLKKRDRSAQKEARAERAMERRTVQLPDYAITVSELADIIDEKPVGVIKFLMTDLGVMASMTQSLDPATCIAVVQGFGRVVAGEEDDDEDDEEDDDEIDEDSALAQGYVSLEDDIETLQPRAPVVTIMGHVDHGKTSLLDAIRNTRVTKGEAGGITQHIAAYQVQHGGKAITFIDTPGHAAFTDMRERGANVTDIVILVVAADDGVKQQTADSIACARKAGVPLVVAINKIDLETADINRVMSDLTAYDILTEEFGGDVLCSQISAKEGTNLDKLLDKIMLQAEIQDLKANPDRAAEGIVVEAYVERGLGTVATTLIKKGTLRVGDIFVAGETYGKVRALISTNDGKTRLDSAGPSVPVRIVGFEGIPSAGDPIIVVDDEQTARALAENRQRLSREKSSLSYQDGLMDSVTLAFGATKARREMCVVVKADVQGSAEALTRALHGLKLENDEAVVTVKVLVSEAGEVSKSDIAIASVTPATTVLAFSVPASFAAMEDARAAGVAIEYYNIVYDAIESVESRMQEVLSPTPEGEYTGSAVVQEVFNIGGTGNIAGSRCQDGILKKGGNVRVLRGDKILIETTIRTLRNFKAETDSIEGGNECGIGLMDFEDFQAGDVVECYVE